METEIKIRPISCLVNVTSTQKEPRWKIGRLSNKPGKFTNWNDMTYKTFELCLEECNRIVIVQKELDIDVIVDCEPEKPVEEKPVKVPKEKVVSKPIKEAKV